MTTKYGIITAAPPSVRPIERGNDMRRMNFLVCLLVALFLPTLAWAQAEGPGLTPGPAGSRSEAIGCGYTTAAPALVNGQQTTIRCNSDGSLRINLSPTSGVSKAQCSVLCANLAADAAAGSLYSFDVSADSTLSAAAWWLMIYDATSAPVDGTVTPAKCYALPSGTTTIFAAFPTPIPFATGITFGVSTTGCFTKTASTHAFIAVDYQ
jgi:hypothetical protein